MVALSWKTSATITNIAFQPLVGTVDMVEVPISEGKTRSYNKNESPNITTRGWKILVEWKYGKTSWIELKDLKESNPIEVAEYFVVNHIVEEPAFKWWVS